MHGGKTLDLLTDQFHFRQSRALSSLYWRQEKAFGLKKRNYGVLGEWRILSWLPPFSLCFRRMQIIWLQKYFTNLHMFHGVINLTDITLGFVIEDDQRQRAIFFICILPVSDNGFWKHKWNRHISSSVLFLWISLKIDRIFIWKHCRRGKRGESPRPKVWVLQLSSH